MVQTIQFITSCSLKKKSKYLFIKIGRRKKRQKKVKKKKKWRWDFGWWWWCWSCSWIKWMGSITYSKERSHFVFMKIFQRILMLFVSFMDLFILFESLNFFFFFSNYLMRMWWSENGSTWTRKKWNENRIIIVILDRFLFIILFLFYLFHVELHGELIWKTIKTESKLNPKIKICRTNTFNLTTLIEQDFWK